MSCNSSSACCKSSGAVPEPVKVASQLCARGCPLVNGICPIDEAEWNRALEEQKSAEKLRAAAAAAAAVDDVGRVAAFAHRRKWQQRAVLLSATPPYLTP